MNAASLTGWITEHVATACELPAGEIDADRPLRDYGLTSRQALALLAGLEDELDRELPDEVLWKYPTIRALVAALTEAGNNPVPAAAALPAVDAATPVGGRPPIPPDGFADPNEAVAVIGIGCRLPGGINGPQRFWQALLAGEDLVSEVPADRWTAYADGSAEHDAALARTTRAGGFLPDIAGFDAEFFGISPREAAAMDPQQRMLLEVGWEAVEHAGIAPESLRGSGTGVFVGISGNEYAGLTLSSLERVDAWGATGSALSIAANRLSYALDLRGPSMAVDTACSSSLVAVHQALLSLRAGECPAALVAGANLLLGPHVTAGFDQLGITSPDGRCKVFDASADGIARAEGAAAVLLKPLAAARRDGDRVLAVLRGSAVNSDGRSNGITAPNPAAQEDLLRAAYAAAAVPSTDVDYVEAHGTGTPLGDPIEANALGAVLGPDRQRPLVIGSVKSNLGHLEAAAGITGLIKVVLSLVNGQIPVSVHYTEPNPRIPFDRLNLRVAERPQPWPETGRPALAGVSAFGFGGTNAHVVLEQAPPADAQPGQAENPRQFVLSGPRLQRAAERLTEHLTEIPVDLADVEHTLARRAGGRARAVVTARTREELVDGLRAVAAGAALPGVATGAVGRRGPLWVFSGQGAQWIGMGRELLRAEPAFAAAVDEVDDTLVPEWGHALRQILADGGDPGELNGLQPVLFGVHLALARLWQSYGIAPAAVVGHSVGEVAAAVVAGALSVADGVRVAVRRSRYLVLTGDGGAMASLGLPADEVAALLSGYPEVDISGYNAPELTTVAGLDAQVRALVEEVEHTGRLARLIDGDVASHSRRVEPYLEQLHDEFAQVDPQDPTVDWYRTALADSRSDEPADAAYWVANARQPVRFAQAVGAALTDGFSTVMEISPHPVLLSAVAATAADQGVEVSTVPTLRRRADEVQQFHHSLGAALARIDAAPRTAGAVVDLPTTPWQHRRHWAQPPARPARAGAHPLLGARVDVPAKPSGGMGGRPPTGVAAPADERVLWHGEPGLDWFSEQRWDDRPVLPTGCYVEMALAAGSAVLGVPPRQLELHELTVHEPLVLAADTTVTTTFAGSELKVHTRGPDGDWVLHCSATVTRSSTAAAGWSTAGVLEAGEPLDPALLYRRLRAAGVRCDPALATVSEVRVAGSSATVSLALGSDTPRAGYLAHPALLEGSLQAFAAAFADDDQVFLPSAIDSVRYFGDPGSAGSAQLRVRPDGDGIVGAIVLLDAEARVVMQLSGVHGRRTRFGDTAAPLLERLLERAWTPAELPPGKPSDALVVAGPKHPLAAALSYPRVDPAQAAATIVEEHPQAVVVLVDGDGLAEAEGTVLLVRDLVRAVAEQANPPRLLLVTDRAAAVLPGEPGKPGPAALRGLIRVLAYEHPTLHATWLDVDTDDPAAAIAAELSAAAPPADEVAVRDGRRFTGVLRSTEPPPPGEVPLTRINGGYVITGGLGGLGLCLATWLAGHGAGRLVLNGRSEPSTVAAEVISRLREAGTDVRVELGDVAEPGVAERLLATAGEGTIQARGVLHAAAVFDDRTTLRLDADTLHRSWLPKAHGAWRLHEATVDQPLDWWLVFSSVVSLAGLPGQPAYATANAYADAVVDLRRAQGLPGTVINWGTWADVGAAAGLEVEWLHPIRPAEGLAVIDATVRSGRAGLGALRLNTPKLAVAFPQLTTLPFLGDLLAGHAPDQLTGGWPGRAALAGREPADARRMVAEQLKARVASVLGLPPSGVDEHAPLPALGVDSLLATRIRNAVEHDLELALPLSLVLRGATLADVTAWVFAELELTSGAARSKPTVIAVPARDAAERLVVIAATEVLARPVGVTHNLAELCADDGTAARLAQTVGERAGVTVTPEQLREHPTPELFAQVIRDAQDTGGPVRVLREGTGRPLFVFHPGGGNTVVYRQLVDHLDPDLPVYGFDRVDDTVSVPQRAARFVTELQRLQPSGPYRLAGWSFGAFLAFEAAQQLSAVGEQVEALALIDPILPLPLEGRLSQEELTRLRLQRYSEFLHTSYGKPITLPYDELSRLDEPAQADALIAILRAAGVINEQISGAILEHQRAAFLDARLLERYEPRPYVGPVTFYSARQRVPGGLRDPRFDRLDLAKGWDAYCPQLDIVEVPTHHLALLDPPNVQLIAKHLDGALTDTESAQRHRWGDDPPYPPTALPAWQ